MKTSLNLIPLVKASSVWVFYLFNFFTFGLFPIVLVFFFLFLSTPRVNQLQRRQAGRQLPL